MCCGRKFDEKWEWQDCEKTGKDDVNDCLTKESSVNVREKILQCDVADEKSKFLVERIFKVRRYLLKL